MNTNDAYAAFKDETPAEETFAALNALVEAIHAKELEVETVATDLAKKQEELRILNNVQLVNLMDELKLEKFRTSSGLDIEIEEKIEAGISEQNRAAAHKWLEDNGHGGMIKRQIGVDFAKNQQAAADALVKELTGKFSAVTEKKAVHPSTLKAWTREMLKDGKNFPPELFGVFRRRVASITEAKKK